MRILSNKNRRLLSSYRFNGFVMIFARWNLFLLKFRNNWNIRGYIPLAEKQQPIQEKHVYTKRKKKENWSSRHDRNCNTNDGSRSLVYVHTWWLSRWKLFYDVAFSIINLVVSVNSDIDRFYPRRISLSLSLSLSLCVYRVHSFKLSLYYWNKNGQVVPNIYILINSRHSDGTGGKNAIVGTRAQLNLALFSVVQ